MLGRQLTSLLRQPPQARLAAATAQCLCIRTLSTSSPFAGAAASKPASKPGRPKKAVGEPSKPVKRAVKRTARKPTSETSEASEPAAKKVAAKKKVAATKKKAVAKPKPTPKEKTPEQLARIKEQRAKLAKKELVAAALSPPKLVRTSAYNEFMKERVSDLKEKMLGTKPGTTGNAPFAEHNKAISAAWKDMAPADIEHFNHLAHTARDASHAEYKRWIESHTLEEIVTANKARAALRRREDPEKGRSTKWPKLVDERIPKQHLTSYMQFYLNRNASGDFKNIQAADRAKLVGQEWKALDAEEKQKYQNLAATDSKRYADEYKTVFNHPPPSSPLYGETTAAPQQAAAA